MAMMVCLNGAGSTNCATKSGGDGNLQPRPMSWPDLKRHLFATARPWLPATRNPKEVDQTNAPSSFSARRRRPLPRISGRAPRPRKGWSPWRFGAVHVAPKLRGKRSSNVLSRRTSLTGICRMTNCRTLLSNPAGQALVACFLSCTP